MLIKQNVGLRLSSPIKNGYTAILLFIGFACYLQPVNGIALTETITYYLNVSDFAQSFIEIPTSNVSVSSPTIASSYFAGRASIYDVDNRKVGTCSASFLNMQNEDGIFTDISNYLSTNDGLIVTWFTPTKLLNLELDSIINSMVTECSVVITTKVGFSLYFGKSYDLIVSSNGGRIYFQFSRIGMIF